jgi:hypothetical protein
MGAWLLLLVLVSMGFFLARAVWPAQRHWSPADPLRLAAAPVLGFGAASCVFFALRLVLSLAPAVSLSAVVILTAVLAAVAWWRAGDAAADAPAAAGAAPLWLRGLLALAVLLTVATWLMLHAAAPHGEWDAWSIWNLRARFLFRAAELSSAFSPLIEWAHPDYPLLVPGVIALLWHAGGGESTAIAGAVQLLLLVAAVAAPWQAIRLLRGPGMAAVCALAVLSATALVRISASLYADVPLAACMVLAGLLLVYEMEVAPAAGGPALLAGLAAGFAAWTKNEGLLFCLALPAAYAVVARRCRPSTWRPVGWFAAGIALVLSVIGHFKYHMAPANDLVNTANLSQWSARAGVVDRSVTVLMAFAGELLTFGGVLLPPVLVFGAFLFLVRVRRPIAMCAALPLVAATLQLAGYFVTYVAASRDLEWQLSTSLPRLLLHVWPLVVSGILLISEEIFISPAQPRSSRTRSK